MLACRQPHRWMWRQPSLRGSGSSYGWPRRGLSKRAQRPGSFFKIRSYATTFDGGRRFTPEPVVGFDADSTGADRAVSWIEPAAPVVMVDPPSISRDRRRFHAPPAQSYAFQLT